MRRLVIGSTGYGLFYSVEARGIIVRVLIHLSRVEWVNRPSNQTDLHAAGDTPATTANRQARPFALPVKYLPPAFACSWRLAQMPYNIRVDSPATP
jgi:hypothetical protein